ncbi:hypothetical protein [Umezawaea sp. Da 62-37]|uniref:hypothetical protein n=1 Tax=Umezawaea sp. Da 62-37 TaxID=3075927 RepID=UPI0028F6EBC1|nr:hypothetical protein [Umezawaea sp. Da 62-37]WNV82247.1 hypothetical protein RM788_29015 [Umezawaea sp. Da 62-37]
MDACDPFDDSDADVQSVVMRLVVALFLENPDGVVSIAELSRRLMYDEDILSMFMAQLVHAGWVTGADPFVLTPVGLERGPAWLRAGATPDFLETAWNLGIKRISAHGTVPSSSYRNGAVGNPGPTVRVVMGKEVRGISTGQVAEVPLQLASAWLERGMAYRAEAGIGPTTFVAACDVQGLLANLPPPDGDTI